MNFLHRRALLFSLLVIAVAAAVSVAALRAVASGSSTSKSARMHRAPAVTRSGAAIASGFSVLTDPTIPAAPAWVISNLREMHAGSYANAKDLGRGMYLATNDGAVCGWVEGGFGECTDSLNDGDVWLHGTMIRETDSETAPFEVALYGFAHDGVDALEVTTSDGQVHRVAVTNDAFRGTLSHTSFGDIASVQAVYSDGHVTTLNTASQFPATR